MKPYKEKALAFLAVAPEFRLGALPTEQPHPLSGTLSDSASNDLPHAISIMKTIDNEALNVLREKSGYLHHLAGTIRRTIEAGHRVFLCGCGATGRLSLTLETLRHQLHREKQTADAGTVSGFMAGGDVALISSLENFEDFPAYGARQLKESGFAGGDLLIACTEGGETPFVIGATEHASRMSGNKPFFLYCNPDDVLAATVQRSERVLKNPAIEKINLCVGPMALSGSTRLQAATVLMAAAGIGLLFHRLSQAEMEAMIDDFIGIWHDVDTSFLQNYITAEAGFYGNNEYVLYETGRELGISILTDTTERAPTFSLLPFENTYDPHRPISLCYLSIPDAEDSASAWEHLLYRKPRTLEWSALRGVASYKRLLGFDFSKAVTASRRALSHGAPQHRFKIYPSRTGITFDLESHRYLLDIPTDNILLKHLILKMILNTHSTLVMGRMKRFRGNIMVWVKPANNKLIDRAIRYIDLLLKGHGIALSYEEIAYECFETMEKTPPDASVVLACVDAVMKTR